ncbi:MAG: glycosyltransferase family 1 protein, partial [bacterium]|nr:glycosyltransferase family 1 protein [bacterium]
KKKKEIAEAGRREVMEKHLLSHRFEKIMKDIHNRNWI